MIIVTILGLIVMFLSWLEGVGSIKNGLKISFSLIFLFSALRYNYGNDYVSYHEFFKDLNSYSTLTFVDVGLNFEPGWILLNWFIEPLGFFSIVIILSFLNSVIFYRFIKKYVDPRFYWIALFLYIFGTANFLIGLSVMRQNLSLIIFIYSLQYIENKQLLKYALFIVLAAQFHLSAYLLILVYPLGRIQFKINNYFGIVFFGIYLALFKITPTLFPAILANATDAIGKYSVYEGGQEVSSGLGIILNSIFLLSIIYFYRFQDKTLRLSFKLGILGFILIPIGLTLMMIGRLGLYTQPFLMLVYPMILSTSKSKIYSYGFAFFLMLLTVYDYFNFFQSPIFSKDFGTYQTIFSVNDWQ
jgi:hypothetical protein